MSKFDINVQIMELVFNRDNLDWFEDGLVKFLDRNFDNWMINTLDETSVEVFVSGDFDEDDTIVAEEMFDITMYMGIELMKHHGVEDDGGELTELLVDYALEHFLVYPLSELGDEPLDVDNDNLILSPNFPVK